MNTRSLRLAAWAALSFGVLQIMSFVSFVLFAAFEASRAAANAAQGRSGFYPFGQLNDLLTGIAPAALLVVALAWHAVVPPGARAWSRLGVVGCAIAALVNLVTYVLLAAGRINVPQQAVLVITSFLPLGIWMIIGNQLTRKAGVVPVQLAAFGVVCGAALVVGAGTFMLAGGLALWNARPLDAMTFGSPLLALAGIGVVVGGLGSPVWALWLGRVLLSRLSASEPRRAVAPGSAEARR